MNIKKTLLVLITIIAVFTTASCDFFNGPDTELTSSSTTEVTTVTTSFVDTDTETTETTIVTVPTTDTQTVTSTIDSTVETTIESTIETSIDSTSGATTETTQTTTEYVDGAKIEIVAPAQLSYTVYDELELNGLTVTYYDADGLSQELDAVEYTVEDIDMNTYGTKQVSVTYGAYAASFIIEVSLPSYYNGVEGLSGSDLISALRTIVNANFKYKSYDQAKYILDETDQDPNNGNNLILIYLGTSIDGDWNYPAWNREHVWPQSALNGASKSDLHNLKPSDVSENSSRGNKYFADYMSGSTWEPRDEVKGDIARIMFYMVVKWSQLTLVDGQPNIDNGEMGDFSTLLQWHLDDPVDDFEMNRNNVIYSYQNNRNPFIDYPDFVELIWG